MYAENLHFFLRIAFLQELRLKLITCQWISTSLKKSLIFFNLLIVLSLKVIIFEALIKIWSGFNDDISGTRSIKIKSIKILRF